MPTDSPCVLFDLLKQFLCSKPGSGVLRRIEWFKIYPVTTCDIGWTTDWAAAGSVDTDLSFLSFLELYRTDVAQRRMAPGRVVEPLDVIEDVSTSLLPGPVYLPSRSLCLQ